MGPEGRRSAVKRRRRGITRAWAPSARLLLCYRRHFFASIKDRVRFWCRSIILASPAGACARRFLVMDAARVVPAPHLRDKNLIEGAGASILEQRNGRGTAEEQQRNSRGLSWLIISESWFGFTGVTQFHLLIMVPYFHDVACTRDSWQSIGIANNRNPSTRV